MVLLLTNIRSRAVKGIEYLIYFEALTGVAKRTYNFNVIN